jgi:hypothetical protein
MPPISSVFSRGNLSRPVSSIGNISGTNRAVSSALGAGTAKASSSVFHEAYSAQRGTTSIFHAAGQGQQGTTSITHVINGDVAAQTSDDAMRDQIRDDARYRYARKMIRERQMNGETPEGGMLGAFGTGHAAGTSKKFMKKMYSMVKSMPAKYKNLSVADQKYFRDMVRRYAKSMPTGSGFDLRMRNKMKREVYKDTQSFRVNKTDRKSFENLIDQLPR